MSCSCVYVNGTVSGTVKGRSCLLLSYPIAQFVEGFTNCMPSETLNSKAEQQGLKSMYNDVSISCSQRMPCIKNLLPAAVFRWQVCSPVSQEEEEAKASGHTHAGTKQ